MTTKSRHTSIMKMMSVIFIVLALTPAISVASTKHDVNNWSNPSSWFCGSMTPDTSKVDVFYLVSTNVISATDDSGKEVLHSRLTKEDLSVLTAEIQWVRDSVFYKDFNFISPYYHQYTFNGIVEHADKADSLSAIAGKDAISAFDYYMKHINNGRPYILAGFSQGGDMAMHILRHMTKKQYSHMVAAYVIGWKVTPADTTRYTTIRPAKGETDTGVTVSFNSVLDKNGVWNFVAEGTQVCINPVNWKVDATPATFTYRGKPHKVHVEKLDNLPESGKPLILMVETDPEPYHKALSKIYPPSILPAINPNSLHHWDIQLYRHFIHDNAVKRGMMNRPHLPQ